MTIRPIEVNDMESIYTFWENNYKVSDRDTVERIKEFIIKNPEISTLAEENNEVIGTTLGSYDGRKGYIYKVVVREDKKGIGLGATLVKETVKKMQDLGALDIRVFCDPKLIGFYEKCGFKVKEGLAHMQIKKY